MSWTIYTYSCAWPVWLHVYHCCVFPEHNNTATAGAKVLNGSYCDIIYTDWPMHRLGAIQGYVIQWGWGGGGGYGFALWIISVRGNSSVK